MKITSTGSAPAASADVGQDLVDLGRVAVPADVVGRRGSRCTRGSGVVGLGDRPAPETPLLASMMIPVRSTRSSATRGARARMLVEV